MKNCQLVKKLVNNWHLLILIMVSIYFVSGKTYQYIYRVEIQQEIDFMKQELKSFSFVEQNRTKELEVRRVNGFFRKVVDVNLVVKEAPNEFKKKVYVELAERGARNIKIGENNDFVEAEYKEYVISVYRVDKKEFVWDVSIDGNPYLSRWGL